MSKISLCHPFSAKAIGLDEMTLHKVHSLPHIKALERYNKNGFKVYAEYLSTKLLPYQKKAQIIRRFWPTTNVLALKKILWRKEVSLWHWLYNFLCPPTLTIINMSGNLSPYTLRLGRLLYSKNKKYIAMIGGSHVSTDHASMNYYKEADHIIVHTYSQKQKLQKLEGFNSIKINVMPLGVDTSLFKPLEIKRNNTFRLLFVGRLSRLKQVELAIDSLEVFLQEGHTEAQLDIIGPTSDKAYFKELKERVAIKKMTDNVKFIGPLDQNRIIPYYQKADFLLLPSTNESFGMVIVEAMACGTPCVVLKESGGPEEIIEHNKTGLILAKEDYHNGAKQLISDNKKYYELRQKCREAVLTKWSQTQTYNSLKRSVEAALYNKELE